MNRQGAGDADCMYAAWDGKEENPGKRAKLHGHAVWRPRAAQPTQVLFFPVRLASYSASSARSSATSMRSPTR